VGKSHTLRFVKNSPVLRIFVMLLMPAALMAQKLETLENCHHVPTDWADGDSFLVRAGDGKEYTVRLYGADCLETHVRDDSDARRLREQRRYFGISEAGENPSSSIALAKQAGKLASDETARMLAKPFSIHTTFADARGDANYKRIYAFVTTADGKDLATHLVSHGLARAFGVYRETPDGRHRDLYRESLRDQELRASKLGAGAWAHTNWEKLPIERAAQREEDLELGLATSRAKAAPAGLLDPNTAARDELMVLPGVGEVMANRIIEGRPYASVEDLGKVAGIGPKTLAVLLEFLKIQN
jgi:competence protein ComEA